MTSSTDDFRYVSAPIIEAVVELRYPDVSLEKIRRCSDVLSNHYDNRVEENQIEGNLDFSKRSAKFRDLPPKIKLTSSDQVDAFTITINNATWTRLAPYENWTNFFLRIKNDLPKFLKSLGHPPISRIGMRYINRIDFPMQDGVGYHEDYLKYQLVTSPILDPNNGFTWTLQKDFTDLDLTAVVKSATVKPEIPGYGAVLFDIDVSRLEISGSKYEAIIDALCDMRQLKNKIFEDGISEKARMLFNETHS
ncbi:MAG: TIGR04255 family protein [Blastomonas sp.]